MFTRKQLDEWISAPRHTRPELEWEDSQGNLWTPFAIDRDGEWVSIQNQDSSAFVYWQLDDDTFTTDGSEVIYATLQEAVHALTEG